jgi:hypothetical protein
MMSYVMHTGVNEGSVSKEDAIPVTLKYWTRE